MKLSRTTLLLVLILFFGNILFYSLYAQIQLQKQHPFWSNVRFGGNIGLAFGNNRTNIVVAPSAVYQFNEKFSSGIGLNFGYTKSRDFEAFIYGASLIQLYSPIRNLQLSAEFEETGVTRTLETIDGDLSDSYFYPALFLGAGYRVGIKTFLTKLILNFKM